MIINLKHPWVVLSREVMACELVRRDSYIFAVNTIFFLSLARAGIFILFKFVDFSFSNN